ncbi:hypothetical protein AO896_30065 [Pseudomonas aeruginosa]|nr:hypothetical protein APB32_32320 [Pseudomonas aeruginosa]OPD70453.1 hypothetical protein AO896_30065 [Pseudomonas aeruginosa]OPD73589.1 hypothetical protein AO905_33090 [Pseudomonas aeruginosa]OPD89998.1 hypothetical protein AO964_34680 [Pseudomonas aeruginosa]OPD92701.1 hypothetical protein AO976_32745 [Pseudomonas aeruginosa]
MGLQSVSIGSIVALSSQNRRPGVEARPAVGAAAPITPLQALFLCLRYRVMAAVRGRPSGLPGSYCPGLPHLRTAAALFVWKRKAVAPITQ